MLLKRDFLLLWFINAATTLGLELFTITILVTIFAETGSTLQAAGTLVARKLPAFLLGPVAGVLVDRFRRRTVLLVMDGLRIILIGLAIWLLNSRATVPVAGIYLLLTGLAATGVLHRPARLALIPAVVGKGELVRANSFILASNQIVLAISYVAGGWLILFLPLGQIALGIVVIFGLNVAAALFLRVERPQSASSVSDQESVWQAFLSGWRYLRDHPIARPLTIMESVEHLPHGIWSGALMLAFTIKALNGNAADWGYQSTGYFSGMIVGSLVALRISVWLSRYPGRVIVWNALAAGVLTLTFASAQTVWMAVLTAFVFGPPFAIRDVAQDALLQGTVTPEQLGRVYATREMLRNVVFMFAGLFFAWLSDLIPVRSIYMIGGVIYLLTGIYALSNKAVRESKLTPAAAD